MLGALSKYTYHCTEYDIIMLALFESKDLKPNPHAEDQGISSFLYPLLNSIFTFFVNLARAFILIISCVCVGYLTNLCHFFLLSPDSWS